MDPERLKKTLNDAGVTLESIELILASAGNFYKIKNIVDNYADNFSDIETERKVSHELHAAIYEVCEALDLPVGKYFN